MKTFVIKPNANLAPEYTSRRSLQFPGLMALTFLMSFTNAYDMPDIRINNRSKHLADPLTVINQSENVNILTAALYKIACRAGNKSGYRIPSVIFLQTAFQQRFPLRSF